MLLSSLWCCALTFAASVSAISAAHHDLRPMILTAGSGRLQPGTETVLCHREHAPARGMEVDRIKVVTQATAAITRLCFGRAHPPTGAAVAPRTPLP